MRLNWRLIRCRLLNNSALGMSITRVHAGGSDWRMRIARRCEQLAVCLGGEGCPAMASVALPRHFSGGVESGSCGGLPELPMAASLAPGEAMEAAASSSARFGVDIGGTLCKVVYFQPLRSGRNGGGLYADSKWSTSAQEALDPEHGSGGDGERVVPPAGPATDLEGGGAGGLSEMERAWSEGAKIWVSSHDPIVLPGRGTLYFKCFETWQMEEFLRLTKKFSLVNGGRAIGATGGGAKRFGKQFLEIAGLQLQRADELKSLVRGIDFLARHAHSEGFEYPTGCYEGGVIQKPLHAPGVSTSSEDGGENENHAEESTPAAFQPERDEVEKRPSEAAAKKKKIKVEASVLLGPVLVKIECGGVLAGNKDLYPYLVVNIGSGVSMLRVDSPDSFERVGGTSLGGSTFLGLALALTGCTTFEEVLALATEGDSTEVDMLVGDIYGGDYSEMGLAATTVASSFGKLVNPARRAAAMQSPANLAKAVLLMVTNNIGSIAMLHAQPAGVRHVMFTGSFLHNNTLSRRLLSVAMGFWSKGKMKAIFLRHEGQAGAVGAMLSALNYSDPIDRLLLS